MANVVVVLDENPTRRAEYVNKLRARIAPVPGLKVSACEGTDWSMLWAAAPMAPVNTDSDGMGGAVVWGDALDDAGHRQTAAEIRKSWRDDETTTWDGFHLVAVVERQGRLTACADVLGAFPVYYWQGAGVVLVGTSVELFTAHPAFSARLAPAGLAGILLTNGQVGGATLWTGVRRLGVRHQLRVRNGRVSEVETYRIPENDCNALELPLAGHVELLADSIQKAVRRHVHSGEHCGLLLSGGLDSRQLGGFLVEQGTPVQALTFGVDGDIELDCAKRVANTLGIPHSTAEVPYSAYPAAAEDLAKWLGLAGGFCNVIDWGMIHHMGRLPTRVVLGHMFDAAIGGSHMAWAYDPVDKSMRFENFLAKLSQWGFSPNTLRRLFVPSSHDAIDSVLACLRQTYESCSDEPHLKAWHFDMLTRQRFHVGSAIWPMSFASWPVSPVFDRNVLAVAASMPASSIIDRRVQREVLIARFPKLAAVPLDRNTYDSVPLRPRIRDHLRARARTSWRQVVHGIGLGALTREARFYYRTYDFDSPGWRGVRALAEPYRDQIPEVLRRTVVDELLPKPEASLSVEDRIVDSSNSKMLVGLAIASHHFELK